MRSPIAWVASAILFLAGCDALFVDREQELRDLEDAGTGDAGTKPALPPPPETDSTAITFTNWNIEYFGDPGMGPTNEPLQQANVAEVLHSIPSDVWALQELASEPAFDALAAGMTGFGAVLASDTFVEESWRYQSEYALDVGLLYRTSRLTLLGARVILGEASSDFAGRPPLEVRFRVLQTGRDLVVIVLHLKAQYPTSCEDCWQRRERSAAALKAYLDESWPSAEVIVLGDWNDDVDESIVSGFDTPFRAIVADSERYRYVTDVLSARGEGTTVSYTSTIDHQLASNELAARVRPGSVGVIRPTVSDYKRTTSDHYPVQSQFTLAP